MTAKPFCDGPFRILKGTDWIVGKDKHGDICHVLDQRGWGYLTGKGHAALGLDSATALQMRDDMQQWVVDALNAAWETRADLAAVPAVPAQARKKFPVLGSGGASVDLQLVEDHGAQAKKNHYQTITRLAERGGLCWAELFAVLHNRPFQKIDTNEAMIACRALEARYLAAIEPQPDPRDEVIAQLVEAADGLISYLIDKTESEIGRECRDRDLPVKVRRASAALASAKTVQP